MNNLRGDFLAGASVILLGVTILLLFFVDFPDGSKDVLLVATGVLMTVVKDVYSFEFSTSKSGERSAQVVADMSKNAAAKLESSAPLPKAEAPIIADDVRVEAAGNVTVAKKP